MAVNPDKLAEQAMYDLTDFLQRCWKLASTMPKFDNLIEDKIREHLGSETDMVQHHQEFFIAALNVAKKERKWRRDYMESDEQIEHRDQQDRHAEEDLPEVG